MRDRLPQPGDVIEFAGTIRTVRAVTGSVILYAVNSRPGINMIRVGQWQAWVEIAAYAPPPRCGPRQSA